MKQTMKISKTKIPEAAPPRKGRPPFAPGVALQQKTFRFSAAHIEELEYRGGGEAIRKWLSKPWRRK